MPGRAVSRLVSCMKQILISRTQLISFFPFSRHQDGGFCVIFPAQSSDGAYHSSGHLHVTSQSEKKITPNLCYPFKRGNPFQKPHLADFFLNWVTGPFLNHKGTRTTTDRTARTRLWASGGSPYA